MADKYLYDTNKNTVEIKSKDSVIGRFSVIENELHFLCCFSKEWEAFNSDYIDVLTKKQLHKLKSYLGNFEVYAN
tara:strand:+ start:122 stop:346 length:225 start_codon:yes stop_codon:yes gene_type:complete